MTELAALALPIVVASVFVFVVSSIIHMAPLWHQNDYPAVPDQERARAALGPRAIPPGEYMLPSCDRKAMNSPEFIEKQKQGPNAIITVLPNQTWPMSRTLGLWFVYTLLVSTFAAYVAGAALPRGADYLAVFRFAGVTAFLGYAVALWQMSIWYSRSWGMTAKATFDGLIYSLVAAGAFGWLWPR
jgi:hypothetical protein